MFFVMAKCSVYALGITRARSRPFIKLSVLNLCRAFLGGNFLPLDLVRSQFT